MPQGRRVCPHCGTENAASDIVTICRACGGSLDGTRAPAPTPPPPPMPVPAPIAPRAELPPDIGSPADDEAIASGERPPEPEGLAPSAYANWPLTLPTFVHLPLYIISSMVGFLGLAFLMATHGARLLPHWAQPIGFFGGAIVGLLSAKLIFRALILGRCPRCGGPAVMRTGRPITYECRACGHIHRTSVSGG